MMKPLMLLMIIMLPFIPKTAQAFDADCRIPLHIECEVTDPNGFTQVRVLVENALYTAEVVNLSFIGCRTTANVRWDPIVPNFTILTTSCPSNLHTFSIDGRDQEGFTPVVQGLHIKVAQAGEKSVYVSHIRPAPFPIVSGAFQRMGAFANRKRLKVDRTKAHSIVTEKFSSVAVPILQRDTDHSDVTFPIDVMIVDIVWERADLPSGVYMLRIDDGKGANSAGNISFIDEQDNVAVTLEANVEPMKNEQNVEGFALVANAGDPQEGRICGRRKCFVWKRLGFLRWKFGCTRRDTGAVVNCVG